MSEPRQNIPMMRAAFGGWAAREGNGKKRISTTLDRTGIFHAASDIR
jgi:hypothetical protein